MRKFFYYVASGPAADVTDNEGNFFLGADDIEFLVGQTREAARVLKSNSSQVKPNIYKFDRNPPYKFLGIVS